MSVSDEVPLKSSDNVETHHGPEIKYSKLRVVIFCVFAASSALNFSYSLAYSAYGITVFNTLNITTINEFSIYSSIINIGACLGAIVAGLFLMKLFGRKMLLIAASICSIVGYILHYLLLINGFIGSKACAPLLIISRILIGVSIGFSTTAAPVYIADISPVKIFAYTGCFHQIGIGSGFVIIYAVSYICDLIDKKYNPDTLKVSLIIMPTIIIIIEILHFISLLFLPKSPIWLSQSIKNEDKLKKIILKNNKKLYKTNYGVENLLEQALKLKENKEKFKITDLFTTLSLKTIFICVMLMFFQQFSGVNPLVFNGASIMNRGGVTQATMGLLILGFSQLIGALLTLLSNRYIGFKLNMVISSAILALTHFLLGIHSRFLSTNASLNFLPVLLTCIYYIFFNICWGPIPFIYNGYIYSSKIINIASSIGIFSTWILAFSLTFPYFTMEKSMELYGVFWFYASFMVIGSIFCAFFVPEIRNVPKDEILKRIDRKFIHLKFN